MQLTITKIHIILIEKSVYIKKEEDV